jgi:CheY-like chemotaxis protein
MPNNYVLVVDDDELTLTLMTRLLHSLGAVALTAQDGHEALLLLAEQANQIAMIITDLAMPGMGGLGLAAAIRSEPAYDAIPIIALTARVNIDTSEQALQAGFAAVLAKPFELRKLRKLLEEWHVVESAK